MDEPTVERLEDCLYHALILLWCIQHATWSVSDWTHMMPAWSLISLIYMLLQYSLLPASIGLCRNKAHEQHGWDSCVSDEVYGTERTGCGEHGEKTEKLGSNGGNEQCRRAAARFYGRGSCSHPPRHHHHQVPLPSCRGRWFALEPPCTTFAERDKEEQWNNRLRTVKRGASVRRLHVASSCIHLSSFQYQHSNPKPSGWAIYILVWTKNWTKKLK